MSRKIFVSYKYADRSVAPLGAEITFGEPTECRHYVSRLQQILDVNDHIYKGENDGEPLSQFTDDTIASKLRDKIFDSSVTIVLLSKNMKDASMDEGAQWIPWEIAYSLKEITRQDRTSKTNAMLAIAIPDQNYDYSHAVKHHPCVTEWQTHSFFNMLSRNMFNRRNANLNTCAGCLNKHHIGSNHSYIHPVKWCDFETNPNIYIEHAITLRDAQHEFDLRKMHE